MTWQELKEFCNNLSEEHLSQTVILWREDEAIVDMDAIQLEEDYFQDKFYHDGCIPESEVIYNLNSYPEDYPNGMGDFVKQYSKDYPILSENF